MATTTISSSTLARWKDADTTVRRSIDVFDGLLPDTHKQAVSLLDELFDVVDYIDAAGMMFVPDTSNGLWYVHDVPDHQPQHINSELLALAIYDANDEVRIRAMMSSKEGKTAA